MYRQIKTPLRGCDYPVNNCSECLQIVLLSVRSAAAIPAGVCPPSWRQVRWCLWFPRLRCGHWPAHTLQGLRQVLCKLPAWICSCLLPRSWSGSTCRSQKALIQENWEQLSSGCHCFHFHFGSYLGKPCCLCWKLGLALGGTPAPCEESAEDARAVGGCCWRNSVASEEWVGWEDWTCPRWP